MLYHVKANQNFSKNKSKTRKFPPGILVVVNKSSYGKLLLISELLGILRAGSKGKISILIFFVLLTTVCLVSDDFQTFLTINQTYLIC